MKSIKACRNIWGNWNGFIGSKKVADIGQSEFDAKEWISERMKQGEFSLSAKSDITEADIAKHRAGL